MLQLFKKNWRGKVSPDDASKGKPSNLNLGDEDSGVIRSNGIARESKVTGDKDQLHPSLSVPHSHTSKYNTNMYGQLGTKHGSLASYFYAPHPVPGSGVCFSPDGELMLRYGFSPEIKVLHSSNATLAATVKGSTGTVSHAAFSSNGKHLVASTDDCRLLVFDLHNAIVGKESVICNIYVGKDPLQYCVLSSSSRNALSCDDDGQLRLWDVASSKLIRNFDHVEPSKLAKFSADSTKVISCHFDDLGVAIIDTSTGKISNTELFPKIVEGRNQPSYSMSANGKQVLVFTKDQTNGENLAIFNTESQTYKALKVCGGAMLHAGFSINGDYFLVAGRDNRIHMYNANTGELMGTLEGHESDVMYCEMSADQRTAISGDNSGNVLLWDLATFQLSVRLQAHDMPVLYCALVPDGSRALSLDVEGHAHVWYMDAKGVFDCLADKSDQLCSCSMSEDGTRMVVGYVNGGIKMWTLGLTATKLWETTAEFQSPVLAISMSPTREFIASSDQTGKLVLSSIIDGTNICTVTASNRTVTDIQFSFLGDIMLTCSLSGQVQIWDKMTTHVDTLRSRPPKPTHTLSAPGAATACSLCADGSFAAVACDNGQISVWTTCDGNLKFTKLISDMDATAIQFSESGSLLLVGSRDGSTSVYDTITGLLRRTLVANAAGINSVYFEDGRPTDRDINGAQLVSLCGLQALSWELTEFGATRTYTADFIADERRIFNNRTIEERTFVAHGTLALYDAKLSAAMYNMRDFDKLPGDSYLFKNGTSLVKGGVHNRPMVMFAPCNEPITILMNEGGGARSIDFSSDGRMVVCGSSRGELTVWDLTTKKLIRLWMAHKRCAVTCVKFSHDSEHVFSCGSDGKVILWDWNTMTQEAMLSGHTASVVGVEMCLDGSTMVSADKHGVVIVWDVVSRKPHLTLPVHEGPALCCTISPDGKKFASSGKDENITIRSTETGEEILSLNDALDGEGLTVKFSLDGTRLQVGGENGDVLVWSVAHDCLIYEIKAHEGKVFDCSWSGDSRQLLSVGADGKVRLWDSAAGSEICQANFEVGFGDVETGGFIRADLSSRGDTMIGCTAKGHLIQWDIHKELRRIPNGGMLYTWLSSLPVSKAREVYRGLLEHHPLIMNAQDSQGWTVLMHAVADNNPEITKIILGFVKPKSALIGLSASHLVNSPGMPTGSMAIASFNMSPDVSQPPGPMINTYVAGLDSYQAADKATLSKVQQTPVELLVLDPTESMTHSANPKTPAQIPRDPKSKGSRVDAAPLPPAATAATAANARPGLLLPDAHDTAILQPRTSRPPIRTPPQGVDAFKAMLMPEGSSTSLNVAPSAHSGHSGHAASTHKSTRPAKQAQVPKQAQAPKQAQGPKQAQAVAEGLMPSSSFSTSRSTAALHPEPSYTDSLFFSRGQPIGEAGEDIEQMHSRSYHAGSSRRYNAVSSEPSRTPNWMHQLSSSLIGQQIKSACTSIFGSTKSLFRRPFETNSTFNKSFSLMRTSALGGQAEKLSKNASHMESIASSGTKDDSISAMPYTLNPNALAIAIHASSTDCVSLLLDAIVLEKVSIGSYGAVTQALPSVAQNYPDMVYRFLSDLSLMVLGEIEIPASIAKQGVIVEACNSYASYKEMWQKALQLDRVPKGPMVMMRASMVRLPYSASLGKDSLLETLVSNAQVPVMTFGSNTVKAIINYKWDRFAKRQIFFKALIYMVFIITFTLYAIFRSDEDPDENFTESMQNPVGRAVIILSLIVWVFGLYFSVLEGIQMVKLGLVTYFSSGWNLMDIAAYSICLVICPCEIFRVGLSYDEFIWPLVAIETLLLWMKVGFFAFAVDGLGNFIYMASEILKGMRYFVLLLVTLWVMFAVAFMNLFPKSYVYKNGSFDSSPPPPPALSYEVIPLVDPNEDILFTKFNKFGRALMTTYMTTYEAINPHDALLSRHPVVSIILICAFNFIVILLLTNMLITLMADIYYRIRDYRDFVFLENRGELVIEVETTMTDAEMTAWEVPPFLHILEPLKDDSEDEDEYDERKTMRIIETVMKSKLMNEANSFQAGGDGGDQDNTESGGDEDDQAVGKKKAAKRGFNTVGGSTGARAGLNNAISSDAIGRVEKLMLDMQKEMMRMQSSMKEMKEMNKALAKDKKDGGRDKSRSRGSDGDKDKSKSRRSDRDKDKDKDEDMSRSRRSDRDKDEDKSRTRRSDRDKDKDEDKSRSRGSDEDKDKSKRGSGGDRRGRSERRRKSTDEREKEEKDSSGDKKKERRRRSRPSGNGDGEA